MENPYAPASATDLSPSVSRLTTAWNAIIGSAFIAVSFLIVSTFKIHLTEYDLTGDGSVLIEAIIGDLSQVALVLAFLVALSSVPLHKWPLTTRVTALVICGLVSFHFTRHEFTRASLIRGIVASMVLSPLLFAGCGYPFLLKRSLLWFRKGEIVEPHERS